MPPIFAEDNPSSILKHLFNNLGTPPGMIINNQMPPIVFLKHTSYPMNGFFGQDRMGTFFQEFDPESDNDCDHN